MSYEVVEDGLRDVIRKLGNYDSSNCVTGNYRPLGGGKRRVVVLQPGAVPDRSIAAALRRIRTLWVVNIELYIRFRTDVSTIADDIRTDRQEIIDQVDKWPKLDATSGVVNAFITSVSEPEMWRLGESRNWWRQVLRCEIEERVNVTASE